MPSHEERWAFGSTGAVMVAEQKDAQYAALLQRRLHAAAQSVLGVRRLYALLGARQHALLDFAGAVLYRLLSVRQSLGEEYAQLMLVDARRGAPASPGQRLAAHLMEMLAHGLLVFGVVPEAAPVSRALAAAAALVRAAAMWHAGSGLPVRLALRVLGLRLVHAPRRAPVRPARAVQALYRVAAVASLIHGTLSLMPNAEGGPEANEKDALRRAQTQCALCMDAAREPACAECGHVFCWRCIHAWIAQRGTCPVCRRALTHAALFSLCNLPVLEDSA